MNKWIYLTLVFLAATAYGEDSGSFYKNFGAKLGTSLEYGQLGNSDMDLKDRSMGALSLEALPGFQLSSKWFLGLDFNYRLQQQITTLYYAGDTNLKGKAWQIGLGAQYRFNQKWALQAAIDFLGKYSFDKQTSSNNDDHLESPKSLRLKGQYYFQPNWTADLSANYIQWDKFVVDGESNSDVSTQWMVGVGITYHFGSYHENKSTDTVQEDSSVSNSAQSEVTKVLDAEKTDTGFKINLPSLAFEPSKSEVSSSFKDIIKEAGSTLAKYPDHQIHIIGHTDSTGNAEKNITLSKMRAESVKNILVENGVKESQITTEGIGSAKPLESDSTSEGRAKNRRVEILVNEKLNGE